MRLSAFAAKLLYEKGEADSFFTASTTQFSGMSEPEWRMLKKLLVRLGIPKKRILVKADADTTDSEILSFKAFLENLPELGIKALPSILVHEAKRDRIERILSEAGLKAKIWWVEEVCATASSPEIKRIIKKWRRSPRYLWIRIFYGILPPLVRRIDPSGKILRYIQDRIRH